MRSIKMCLIFSVSISLLVVGAANAAVTVKCKKGDLNGDGVISSFDALVADGIAGGGDARATRLRQFPNAEALADVDGDGKVTKIDAKIILEAAVGKAEALKTLGCEPVSGNDSKKGDYVWTHCKKGDLAPVNAPDGKIAANDATAAYKLMGISVDVAKKLVTILPMLDLNGNGRIDESEVEALKKFLQPGVEIKPWQALLSRAELADIDGDGKITKNDGSFLMKVSGGSLSDKEVQDKLGCTKEFVAQ